MLSICGLECCGECNKKNDCGGCVKTDGHKTANMPVSL